MDVAKSRTAPSTPCPRRYLHPSPVHRVTAVSLPLPSRDIGRGSAQSAPLGYPRHELLYLTAPLVASRCPEDLKEPGLDTLCGRNLVAARRGMLGMLRATLVVHGGPGAASTKVRRPRGAAPRECSMAKGCFMLAVLSLVLGPPSSGHSAVRWGAEASTLPLSCLAKRVGAVVGQEGAEGDVKDEDESLGAKLHSAMVRAILEEGWAQHTPEALEVLVQRGVLKASYEEAKRERAAREVTRRAGRPCVPFPRACCLDGGDHGPPGWICGRFLPNQTDSGSTRCRRARAMPETSWRAHLLGVPRLCLRSVPQGAARRPPE